MAEDDKKALAKAGSTAVGAVIDYGEDAGAGFENQTQADVSIPFLAVLQAMSPVCEPEDSPHRPGMLFNTVSEESVKGADGILFVPGVTRHVVMEWKPRDQGGGIVGEHAVDSDIVKEAQERSTEYGKLKTLSGNDLIETFYVYGVQVDEDGETVLGPLVIPFTSTKIKRYKAWNSRLNMFAHKKHGMPGKPPLFAHLTKVTTTKEKNAKGDFHNITLAPARGDVFASLLKPDNDALAQARQIREMVASGIAKPDYASAEKAQGAGGGDDAGGAGDPDKAPF